MNVSEARTIARGWIEAHAAPMPGFRGALWHGSILTLPDDAPHATSSDIDIMVIADDPSYEMKSGKRQHQGLLLDVTVMQWNDVRDPEAILANHNLAPSFRSPRVVADPTGDLARVQEAVARDFARRTWVERRTVSAHDKIKTFLGSMDPVGRPLHENVSAWLFGTGVTTHVLLVAGMRNPTVRKRYLAARDLLRDYGIPEEHERLLAQLGCADMSRADVDALMPRLADAYDVASMVIRSPFFFASDINPMTRAIAIGGSHELIDSGNHREAIFWIVATWARCMDVFHHDDPEQEERFTPGFMELLATLGITSYEDMRRRADEVIGSLPHLMEIATAIMDANPDIEC